jgi:ATP-dependent helicase/nuclease subunit A
VTSIVDEKQRIEALNPNESFMVQAPAGSGKTEILIQRYLTLLGGVENPQQIISMTFTRKAAGEMKKRILAALQRGLNNTPPESTHEHQTWKLARLALKRDKNQKWRLLDNPNQFQILTIDSFCAGITKQMPILSLMGGPIDVVQNPDNLYRETAKRLLSKVESNDETGNKVRTILKHLDNSKTAFLHRINQLLLKRDQWMIPFFDKFEITDEKRNYFESALTNLIESILMDLNNHIPINYKNFMEAAKFAGNNCKTSNPDSPIAELALIENFPGSNIKNLKIWQGLAELTLTKNGEVRKSINKSNGFPSEMKQQKVEFINLLETLTEHKKFTQILHQVRIIPESTYTNKEWAFLKSTLLLLPDIAETLRVIFTEQRKTDFTEISLAARDALGNEDNPTDLLLYLDHKIQHILVDEYQDISYKQYDLLIRLTSGWTPGDGRTMFIVGDPMQSIYRFRDAEVGLFLKTKEDGIGHIDFKFLSLKTNFRSQKPIVDWVNSCFKLVFPSSNNKDLGAITYSPSKAEQTNIIESGVSLHPVDDSSKKNEATEVTQLVLSLHNKYPDKSIAILVRARNHLTEIIKQFHIKKLKFQAEDIDPLTSRPEIIDLLALMRALTSFNDRVAWLSILRAPWCGLSLEDLHKICTGNKNTPIWILIQNKEIINTLSVTGLFRVERVISILKKALMALPISNFRDLIEGCWIELGGPACIKPDTYIDVEIFFDKISEFLESNEASNIELFQTNINKLFANSWEEADNTVQIMTMHKAKGLEFDFVIIPGLERSSKAEEKRLVYWMPHGESLLVAPIEEKGEPSSKVYKFLSDLNQQKSEFETLRLLYVATTRTKSQLHLFGQFIPTNDSSPRKGSLLKNLWPFIQDQWIKESSLKNIGTTDPEKPNNMMPKIRRLKESYVLPKIPPNIEMGIISELQPGSESPEFEWAGIGARHLGMVMHRCFQTLAEEGKNKWTKERIKIMESSIPAGLKSYGLPSELAEVEGKKGITMIQNILSHKIGQWILEDHKEARCEYSLTQIINNSYQSNVIDRTFIDKNNVRWIIDYKTGNHTGSDLKTFFKNEKERYRKQLDKYENLFKLSGEARQIKKALYYPMHKELLEIE